MAKVLLPLPPASSHTTLPFSSQLWLLLLPFTTNLPPTTQPLYTFLPLLCGVHSLLCTKASDLRTSFRSEKPFLTYRRQDLIADTQLSMTSNLSLHSYNSPIAYAILQKCLFSPVFPLYVLRKESPLPLLSHQGRAHSRCSTKCVDQVNKVLSWSGIFFFKVEEA